MHSWLMNLSPSKEIYPCGILAKPGQAQKNQLISSGLAFLKRFTGYRLTLHKGATIFGNGNGTAKGGSPKARVAAYKVCWSTNDAGGCHEADILQAFDYAIYDGVDVISASVGASNPYIEAFFADGVSIGAFHAVARNIVVVSSAGNDGPAPRTVTNLAPWSFTVAATTQPRVKC
ncbi:hypothetical protein VNO78_15684 [Psophocarpus tetragonolobus]|uniref:Peptidase S8/S53 domain-containing protein n=1 Tax=Psophocarpus tetragonolobus TaxID=3891 RepID=A0AAN9SGX4_PSOTE